MAIITDRIDGQNIGIRFTAPSLTANVLSVDLSTAAVTSTYLSTSDKQVIRAAVLDLFALVPLAERLSGALGFLQRLVSVAAADNSTITPTASVVGNVATLVVTVGAAPANVIIHVPFSAEGTVAWASGIATGGGGGGAVNAVTASAPLASSGGANPDISLAGIIPVANGGTGLAVVPVNGQVLVGNGVDYTATTITAGTAIAVTNGAGSITIASNAVTSVGGAAPISSSGGAAPVISLGNSGVAAGVYGDSLNVPQVTVDAHGLVTNVTDVGIAFPVASVTGSAPVSVTPGANPVVSLDNSGVAAGVYGDATNVPAVTVDAKGLVTNVTNTPITFPIAAVSVSSPLTSTGGASPTLGLSAGTGLTIAGANLDLANTTVTAAPYGVAAFSPESKMPQFTVDAQGRLTAASEAAIEIGGSPAKTYVDTQDAATLASANAYAQSLTFNLSSKEDAHVATAAALPAYNVDVTFKILTATVNGALPLIDGETLLVGQRVLVKDEAGVLQPNNGLYEVTALGDGSNPWVLTRTTDADSASELCGSIVPVDTGTQAGTVWLFSANSGTFTLGTTNVIWTQLSIAAATTLSLGSVQLAGGLGGLGTSATSPKLDVDSVTTGTLPVTHGGTGLATVATGDLLVATAPDTLSALAGGASGTVLKGQGAGVAPAFGAVSLTADVSGILPAANGGSGLDASAAANGELLIGNGTGFTLAAITAGTGINVTNGVGTITIDATNAGAVTNVTATGPLASSGGQTPDISLTGTVPVANGGTGLSTAPTAGQFLVGNGLGGYAQLTGTAGTGISITPGLGTITIANTGVTAVGASGPLASSGGTTPSISLTGVIPVANGGTNSSATPTNGQLLIGNGTDYSVSTLTPGTGINITDGAGSITVANSGVLSVGASGPLASSGGQNPSISLTGIVDVANGGTGLSTAPTNGQLLIGNGTDYTQATLTGGDGINVEDGSGYITVRQRGLVSDDFTTGAAIAAGQVCYLAADGKVYPAQANSASTSTVVGIAQQSVGAADLPIILATFNKTPGTWVLTPGTEYFLSATVAGAVVPYSTLAATSGAQIVALGYARGASDLQLNIQRRGITP